jgi:uridine kinase
MRDKVHRGSSFDDTLRKFGSVCRGERLFIDPYRENADLRIDTFLPYELNVYAGYLRESLAAADPALLKATGADKCLELLGELTPIPTEKVATDSLIQEFLAL